MRKKCYRKQQKKPYNPYSLCFPNFFFDHNLDHNPAKGLHQNKPQNHKVTLKLAITLIFLPKFYLNN
jgi:hypothetical protein